MMLTCSNHCPRKNRARSPSALRAEVSEKQTRLETVLKRNDILDTTYTDGHSYLIVNHGRGHEEPKRIFSEFDVTAEKYEKYGTMPIADVDRKSAAAAAPKVPADDPERAKRHEELRKLAAEIDTESNWK